MAREVPTACDAVPILRLWAMELRTCPTSSILNPNTAPNSPTNTTIAAVSEGMPCNDADTSIAIGVVTDLGANEIITASDAPIHFAVNTTETMPTKHPVNWETNNGTNWRRMLFNCK